MAKCFNEDRPWDWFARVHLAGDKMPGFEGGDYSIEQALAAATPLNGPRTFENAAVESFVLMDKLDEGIEFFGRSLMGISLECARCHDHKFDLISQRDYYALLGFFQSSGHAPLPIDTKSRAEADQYALRLTELMKEKSTLEGRLRHQALVASIAAKKTRGIEGRKHFINNRTIEITPKAKRLHEIDLVLLNAESVHAQSQGKSRLADDIRKATREKEKMLADFIFSAPNQGPSFDHFINGHKSQIGLIERAEDFGLTELTSELKEHDVFWAAERKLWGRRYRFGGFAKSDPAISELARMDDRIHEIEAELPANVLRQWEEPKPSYLYVRTDGGLRRAQELKDLPRPEGAILNANDTRIAWLFKPYIGDARILDRGDVLYPGELIPRGFPEFFGESKPRLEGSGRLQLANWLTAPDSTQAALVARTAVNRAWQQLLGEALCRTPKELGRLGERPELPEVVDGLAASFIRDGWSLKQLVRRIVLSEVYRRDSLADEANFAKDPDNRYFARQTVRRLEYEPIANTMAWLRQGERFDTPQRGNSALPDAAEYPKHFDGPSVYELTERRVVSITPTQSLVLMNNPNGPRRLAGDLVSRLGFTAETVFSDALSPLYTAIVQRPPTDAERELHKVSGIVAGRKLARRCPLMNSANSPACCCAGMKSSSANKESLAMITRRQVLSSIAAAPGIVATGSLWADDNIVAEKSLPLHHPGKVKSIIFYYCKGGPSQAHTFDKPRHVDDPSLYPWDFKKSGQSGLEISELFPRLQNMADDLCLIRSGYGAVASHAEAGLYIFTGASKLGASLGAWMLHGLGSGNPNLPGHVLLTGRAEGDKWAVSNGEVHGGARSVGAGGLPPALQAQTVTDLQRPIANLDSPISGQAQKRWLAELSALNAGFAARHSPVAALDARTESFHAAHRMQTAAPEAFDFATDAANPAIRKLYGLDPQETRSTGTKLLLARRLVERGVRFILVPSVGVPGGRGDWDTHTPTQVRGALPKLALARDQPLAGLITDLKERGLLEQTLVVWGGEMGRGGPGHMNHNGSAFTWWMAGGGVRPGFAYGATDEQGFTAVENPVHVRDLHATILWMCGLDYRKLTHNGIGFDTTCKVAKGIIA